MTVFDVLEILGWTIIISFSIAIANYVLKFLHKSYVSKLSKKHPQFVTYYRKVMKMVIKVHKLAGLVAGLAVLSHFLVAFTNGMLRTSGIIAAVILGMIVSLGIYGAYVHKGLKKNWLILHRLLAFALIVAIINHVLF
jgi:hypothetical protein